MYHMTWSRLRLKNSGDRQGEGLGLENHDSYPRTFRDEIDGRYLATRSYSRFQSVYGQSSLALMRFELLKGGS